MTEAIARMYARIAARFVTLATMSLCGLLSVSAHAEPRIEWRVENPFRFFSDPADTEVHRATWLALSPEERKTPVLSSERALSARHPDGWAATMFRRVCWDPEKNRFVCPGGGYVEPKSHAIVAQISGVEESDVIDCVWVITPRGRNGSGGDGLSQPCQEPARLDVPYPEGATIAVEVGGQTVAQTEVRVRDFLIAGMGDSFASGEGNPDLPVRFSRERSIDYGKDDLSNYPARAGTWKRIGDSDFMKENAVWLDQACHRSLYSHQARAALQLAIEDPHRAVTFVGVACAGAEITEGLFLRWAGNEWVPNPPDQSQISYVAEAQCGRHEAETEDLPEAYHLKGKVPDLKGGLTLKKCKAEYARKIDLLFLSIGGNDIGFSRVVANAVLADESLLKKIGGWFGAVITQSEAAEQLGSLDNRFKSLNRALHNILQIPWNENDRVILTAYPGLALLGDGSVTCPDGHAGMEVMADFRMSEQKVRDGVWLGDKLNRAMERNAAAYGWTLADAHRPLFIGRGVCAGFTDNAFSIADDLRLPRKSHGQWAPYNPADYRAYASRQRWFRTPNDAFLTANFHVTPNLLAKVLKLESFNWVQVLLASTYSGAFHPTAEGQAAMADAVVEKARGVLEKYEVRRGGGEVVRREVLEPLGQSPEDPATAPRDTGSVELRFGQ